MVQIDDMELITAVIRSVEAEQSEKGEEKYGHGMRIFDPYDWNLMALEELVDGSRYAAAALVKVRELAPALCEIVNGARLLSDERMHGYGLERIARGLAAYEDAVKKVGPLWPVHQWQLLDKTTPSGKVLYGCSRCGLEDPAPVKEQYENRPCISGKYAIRKKANTCVGGNGR